MLQVIGMLPRASDWLVTVLHLIVVTERQQLPLVDCYPSTTFFFSTRLLASVPFDLFVVRHLYLLIDFQEREREKKEPCLLTTVVSRFDIQLWMFDLCQERVSPCSGEIDIKTECFSLSEFALLLLLIRHRSLSETPSGRFPETFS
jgi:hypothetical protein